MRTLIEVTQQDILDGRQDSTCACPIALAMKRVFNTRFVRVENADARVIPESEFAAVGLWYKVPTRNLPTRAKRFVRKYDRQGASNVKPFKFYLPEPGPEPV